MALDPRIILSARQPQLSINNPLKAALQAQSIQTGGLRNQLLEQQLNPSSLQNQALGQSIAAGQQKMDASQQERERRDLGLGLQAIKPFVDAGDMNSAVSAIGNMSLDPEAKQDILEVLQGDPQNAQTLLNSTLKALGGQGEMTAGQREFAALTEGFSSEDIESAKRIKVGLDPRAVGSAVQTITEEGTGGQIAETEETIAAGRETGRLTAQKKLLPQIRADIKKAEAKAALEGEAFTDASRYRAALPGMRETVAKLKPLADIATFTMTGKAFNAISKELGFSTAGGTARKQMESIVNNQVLPTLRATFGAAFTAAEGDRLRDTWLDPDSSPEAKKATLDTVIAQAEKNIETSERLGREAGGQSQTIDTGISVEEFRAMTPEQRAETIRRLQAR